jgi:hypothetical protein
MAVRRDGLFFWREVKLISRGVKMQMRAAPGVLAAAIVLSGCTAYVLKEKLKPYQGQSASALIAKLGFPTGEEQIAGKKVYVWSISNLVEGTTQFCTIRAILGDQDVIASVDYTGNENGCKMYALKLMSN